MARSRQAVVENVRKIRPDGIRFQGLRYTDPLLAAYVGEDALIRYDPRDLAEIRVFHNEAFLCRAICPELAGHSIGIKDITAARQARHRELAKALGERASVVDRLLHIHQPPHQNPHLPNPGSHRETTDNPRPRLKRYQEE